MFMAHDPTKIRSFALIGHGGAGKTQLADALARTTGKNTRLGTASDGSSLFDIEDEELKRGGSITSHLLSTEHGGFRYHIIDTPGDGNFVHDARACLQAVDAGVLVVSAVDGVEVNTDRTSRWAAELDLPRAVFVNKMDRERADYSAVLTDIKDILGLEPVLMQLPIGTEDGFRGVVNLMSGNAFQYDGDGGVGTRIDVPEDMVDAVETALEELMESVSMADDDLVERYLDEGTLTEDEVRAGLRKGIEDGTLVPVLLGSASRNIGTDLLLELAQVFPDATTRDPWISTDDTEIAHDPDGLAAALCFKTVIDPFAGKISLFRVLRGTVTTEGTWTNARKGGHERFGTLINLVGKKQSPVESATVGEIFGVAKLRDTRTGDTLYAGKNEVSVEALKPPPPMISYTVTPATRGEEDKLKTALGRILSEDPGLRQSLDPVTSEVVIGGMGANHINLSLARMARKYGVKVNLGTPTIPYRETITGKADVRYRHKKQTGGSGQFGEVSIRVEPNTRDAGYEFIDGIVGGAIPKSLIPSVDKGIRSQLDAGVLAGFQIVDLKVTLYDGKTHPVDSKDIAFQIAGRQAIKAAFMQCHPVLLEPIYELEIVVPEDHVGDIMGDMNGRRGRIQTMESRGRNSLVMVLVPLAEIMNYAPDLNSMTGGQGSYTMRLKTYEPVPSHLQDKVVAEIKRTQEDDD
jgi:elongation factor G